MCPVYGRIKRENHWHMDEVPCPFAVSHNRTYDVKGAVQVWIKQPKDGLDKRQCSVVYCFRASGEQIVPPMIIFRGTGKRISRNEKNRWDSRVNVSFQRNAWMDKRGMQEWIKLFRKKTKNTGEKILGLDNLDAHQDENVKTYAKDKCETILGFTPGGCTDVISPTDQLAGPRNKNMIFFSLIYTSKQNFFFLIFDNLFFLKFFE